MKVKFAFDFDGVIANTNWAITAVAGQYLGLDLDPEDTEFYNIRDCFGGLSLEAEREILDLVLTEEWMRKTPEIPGALEGLLKWSQYTEEPITLITSRTGYHFVHALDWLEERRPEGLVIRAHSQKVKGPLCRELGITHFMDDSIFYLVEIANHGVVPIVFDQPYNRNFNGSRLAQRLLDRVYSWKDFESRYLQVDWNLVY